MIPFLENLEFWHWWIAAAVFITLEIFAPGVVFIWLGIASAIVGAALFALPDLAWELQFSIWGMLAVASAVIGRNYIQKNPTKTDEPNLNKRGHQYIDRTFTLEEAIDNGFGKIKVDDSTWKIECGDDLKAGTKVKVISIDNVVLKVEKA